MENGSSLAVSGTNYTEKVTRQTGFSKSRGKFFGVGVAIGIGIECVSDSDTDADPDTIVTLITKVQ